MLKNILLMAAAAASLAVASPAAAQTQVSAGADIATRGQTAGRLDVSGFNLFGLGGGVEARSQFGDGVDELTGRLGYRLGAGRFSLTPTAQLGVANIDRDGRGLFATAGAGVEGRVNILPALDGVASYTYRQAITNGGNDRYRLNDYRVGAELRVNPAFGINAGYFKRTGTVDSEGVAAGVSLKL